MFFHKVRLSAVLIFALGTVMLTAPTVDAQTVHTLLVIMDDDKTLGRGMQVNLDKLNDLLKKVDKVYRVEKDVYLSSRRETTPDNVLRWVRALRPARDDVVFIYYGGHGGMVSKTDRRTYLYLTSGELYRADLEAAVKSHSCRLKIIVTDACSSYPSSEQSQAELQTYASIVPSRQNVMIENLFGQHEGLLHVNGASEGQYGWSDTARTGQGGFFTRSFIAAINYTLYKGGDGFIEWKEVFEFARKATQEVFRQVKNAGLLEKALRSPGTDPAQATLQTPQAYALPGRLHEGPSDIDDPLWELENPRQRIAVSMSPSQTRYRVGDYFALTLRADEDCYVTLLNWDSHGNFTKLFPNKYQEDNFIHGGRTYHIPPENRDFEIKFPGPVGKEMLKLIVVTSSRVNAKINQALERPRTELFATQSSRNAAGDLIAPQIAKVVEAEKTIVELLKELRSSEWAEVRLDVDIERR